jgi:hypothetical protein
MAMRVAERVAWTGGLATHATCTDATSDCRAGFIRHLGRLLYRRPLTDADVQNLLPLFDGAQAGPAAFQEGARLVLQAMLQSPHFLYRLERIDGLDARSRHPTPSPFEVATRLSYLLWLSAPTPDLLDAAARGELSTSAAYQATVARMLADGPRLRRGFEGYARDWLQLYRLDARTPYPAAGVTAELIAEMKNETLRFLDRIALTEQRDLTALLTDRRTDVGPELAAVYGVDPISPGQATYEVADDPHRIGILTQPGFLILRAPPQRVTIVHRGLMVMRVFLCEEPAPPPPGAAAQIDAVPTDLTDRDRFALHTASPACQGCHEVFDPLGYPFEPFDLAGRFRTNDQHGNPLRSDGEVALDGATQPFRDTAEFATLLASSATVHRCLMSKVAQYALGRSLQDADGAAVDEMARRFEADGRTYSAALLAVASSPAFRAMGSAP